MKNFLIALSLSVALMTPAWAERKNLITQEMCALIPSFADSQAPYARKGLFAKAFRDVRRGKLERAHQQFTKRYTSLEKQIKKLFQGAGNQDVTNRMIQSFLEKHVLGPRPALITSLNDFQLLPEVALTWTHVQCMLGDEATSWRGLLSLHRGSHPDVFQVKALAAFSGGDHHKMEALIQRRREYGERDVMRWVIAGLWHVSSGRSEEAEHAHATAARSCMSPKECAWAHWLGRYLSESSDDKQP